MNRLQLWARILAEQPARRVAEIGVWRGEFAQHILDQCPAVERYYMIDPWRQLDRWRRPLNTPTIETAYEEALAATDAHADRRVVLRGTTAEVIDQIPDNSLDFAYVDGDHTLRGITIDLIRVWSKIRPGGIVGGDDFHPSIWEWGPRYEPNLVHPWAIYFAEAVDAPIEQMPCDQFLIRKQPGYTPTSGETGLLPHVRRPLPEMLAWQAARVRHRLARPSG
jgi:hypothetical protein